VNTVGCPRQLACGGLVHLRPGCHARVDELGDPLELRLRVDCADVGVLVERISDAQYVDPVPELSDEQIGNGLLH
jgi:hypothetical protein